jgi:hypothetical protein
MRACRLPATLAVCLLLLLSLAVAGGEKTAAQDEVARISASMNSFYYAPGERAYINVDLELSGAARADDCFLELLVYPSAPTRSQLSAFREGTRRYVVVRRTLETISPESEWTDKLYEVDLNALGLKTGVYPLEVRLTQGGGEALATDQNFLVIMDPASGYPLNLSLLWTIDFLPSTDATGTDLDSGLASACSSSTGETGFLYDLTKVMIRTPEVRSSMVLPATTYGDLEALADAAGEEGSGDEEEGASEVLAGLDDMFADNQLDLLSTTYAFADQDILASQGWEDFSPEGEEKGDDATRQLRMGLDFASDIAAGGKGFVAPLFRLSDLVLQNLVASGVEFTVVGREALESSAAGRRLLEGTTISQPVRFVNSNGYTIKSFVRDDTLYAYLETSQGADPSHVIQNIFAELAVLQREKPYVVRSCVLAFPPGFMPPQTFLGKFYDAVKRCPWLQTRRLSELSVDQFPLEGVALQAPVYPETTSDYMQKLGAVRSDVVDFVKTIPEDHPLRERLSHSQLVAENYRFTGERDTSAAQAYLNSIEAVIQGETAKVNIDLKRTVTLSSTEGVLNVDVTSSLDYPLEKVTLRMENASLTFPGGNSREVTIEPRENRFVFDVNTHRKGSFIVDIVLESGDLVLSSTTTTVNTSIINTLAIILLVGLAFLVALVVVVRRLLRRYRGGKHSKGRAQE